MGNFVTFCDFSKALHASELQRFRIGLQYTFCELRVRGVWFRRGFQFSLLVVKCVF